MDRQQVALVALRLFERDGFDEVSMDEVARVAKVSRRTLFRLFPSKADLVWDGIREVLERARSHAGKVPPGAPLDAVLGAFFAGGLLSLDDPGAAKLARRRLRLIASSPSLLNHSALEQSQEAIARVLEASRGARGPPASLVARCLFAVGFAALIWWAQSDGAMAPLDVLRTAMAAVSEASGAGGARRRR